MTSKEIMYEGNSILGPITFPSCTKFKVIAHENHCIIVIHNVSCRGVTIEEFCISLVTEDFGKVIQ